MTGFGHAFYEKLTCPKTERVVRLVDGGEAHCHMNNLSLKHQIDSTGWTTFSNSSEDRISIGVKGCLINVNALRDYRPCRNSRPARSCPLWVIRCTFAMSARCLFSPQLPTSCGAAVSDRRNGPLSDSCNAANSILFDYFVGADENALRDGETERLGGLEIDRQLEFGRLLDRDIAGLRPVQNFVDQLGTASE